MIISLNWLKRYVDIDVSLDELVKLIGARLVEVENVVNIGDKYKDVLIVKVVESSKVEGSDHLSLVKIDDSGTVDAVSRDENGLIQVVCGALNIKAGLTVAWLPPKSIVPNTFGTENEFVLDSRNILGVMSNGMIASSKELDISDEHSGILEINDDVKPGTSFAKKYELDDYLLDIENKSLTNRPDCFGIIGFAREVSSILGKKFKNPDWFLADATRNEKHNTTAPIRVAIDDLKLSSRYLASVMDNLSLTNKSQIITQTYLSRLGVRPINAIVDVTNYMMLLTGQPIHAFDYDKLISLCGEDVEIHVRSGRFGEKLELLDNRVIDLSTEDIVISACDEAIALAGAMGGLNTAIDDSTKRIVIESASFNLYNLRATQMRHGIFSEAITRFTKGQPAELALPVMVKAMDMMNDVSGAECINGIVEDYPVKQELIGINLKIAKVNSILDGTFTQERICDILEKNGFITEKIDSGSVQISVPFWRSDIHIPEDIVEELGRINGFGNIKPILPYRESKAVTPNSFDLFKSKVRRILVNSGANEVLLYSFVHGDTLKKAGQNCDLSYRLVNSISPSLQYYRQSLTPGLIMSAYSNSRQGFDDFALFELGKTHNKANGLSDEGVPNETEALALVITDKKNHPGAAYYRAKRIFDYLCTCLGLSVTYAEINNDKSITSFFEPIRSAMVINNDGEQIGTIGEYKSSVTDNFKISKYTSGFEIDTSVLFRSINKFGNNYSPLSKYPSTDRDICFQVSDGITYSQIIKAAKKITKKSDFSVDINLVDIYKQQNSETKNITIHVKITPFAKTLTGAEVQDTINDICTFVIDATNASVV